MIGSGLRSAQMFVVREARWCIVCITRKLHFHAFFKREQAKNSLESASIYVACCQHAFAACLCDAQMTNPPEPKWRLADWRQENERISL